MSYIEMTTATMLWSFLCEGIHKLMKERHDAMYGEGVMRKMSRRMRSWIGYAAILCLASCSVSQLMNQVESPKDRIDVKHLLFDVSLYQIELLNQSLHHHKQLHHTPSLSALHQLLYTVAFTHDKVVLAYGEDYISRMTCIQAFMQLIHRWQLSGERPLLTIEISALEDFAIQFQHIYETYRNLLSSEGKVIVSQNEKWTQMDAELNHRIISQFMQ
jgi:hypothetical protein